MLMKIALKVKSEKKIRYYHRFLHSVQIPENLQMHFLFYTFCQSLSIAHTHTTQKECCAQQVFGYLNRTNSVVRHTQYTKCVFRFNISNWMKHGITWNLIFKVSLLVIPYSRIDVMTFLFVIGRHIFPAKIFSSLANIQTVDNE